MSISGPFGHGHPGHHPDSVLDRRFPLSHHRRRYGYLWGHPFQRARDTTCGRACLFVLGL